jgi:ring-1,2-phenylacetyl-CoA epoxidase subunit PaaA
LLAQDPETGTWTYSEPDWAELKAVVTGHGPKSQDRLDFRRVNYEQTRWVREAMAGVPTAA